MASSPALRDELLWAALDPTLAPRVRAEALAAGVEAPSAGLAEIIVAIVVGRELLADPHVEVRSEAASLLFWAVRAQFPYQTPAERLATIDAIAPELDAAIAAGLTSSGRMLGTALRASVIEKLRAASGHIPEYDDGPPADERAHRERSRFA